MTPSSFISSSLSIGSLPRASARLTTTRSTPRARTIAGMSSMVPMTPGLITGVPTRGRIRIDEADDLDAEFLASLEQLARQADGGRSGADEQQPLARRHAARQPLEHQPPADDEQDHDQHATTHEHAAADDQRSGTRNRWRRG